MKQIAGLWLLLLAMPGVADWRVDPEGSHVGFASVKNDLIPENHTFTEISGGVSASGQAGIIIALASVETKIPIRNERMQALLFQVTEFPTATVTSTLPVREFTSLATGDSRTQTVTLTIKLHGARITREAMVKVTRSAEDAFEVSSLGPILVHASEFALADGVEALRKVAGLQSIDLMVPVTFNLRLVAVAQE